MIYNDPLIVMRFMDAMKHERGKSPFKLWIYLDQVYSGITPTLINTIHTHADRVYCFTDIWKLRFLEYGPCTDVRVLEHAVDPTVFSCMPLDARKPIRANIGVPDDAIVFLNANRNSQRKRLDLSIGGFARLLHKNQEKPYYLLICTNLNPQSGAYYDAQRIFLEELKELNMDPQKYIRNLLLVDTAPPNLMSDATDIGINTSDGEGFGLCQLEHMYTGAPQVVTDIGSYRTFLNEDVADFVASDGRSYFAGAMPHGLWSPTFSMKSVADAMESSIENITEKRRYISTYQFKSWAKVCDSLLEDVLTECEVPVSIVSVPVLS
jgi:glycosyltransferase involved in cell wall biosynthesis